MQSGKKGASPPHFPIPKGYFRHLRRRYFSKKRGIHSFLRVRRCFPSHPRGKRPLCRRTGHHIFFLFLLHRIDDNRSFFYKKQEKTRILFQMRCQAFLSQNAKKAFGIRIYDKRHVLSSTIRPDSAGAVTAAAASCGLPSYGAKERSNE